MPKIHDEKNMVKIAIGKPDRELFRKSVDEFKRVLTEEMSGGDCDKTIVEAVRLAPSAMNLQPWYIYGDRNQLHIYRRKCAGPLYLEKITSMDIGIALCHIDVAANHLGFSVSYQSTEHPDFAGKKYVTTAVMHKGA